MRTVIKFAGALLEDEAMVGELARHVATLAKHGHEILVVHGGGRAFTATLKRMGLESKFVSGLRVTDGETRDAAVMVFGGLLNKRLAGAISSAGQPAIGVSAADANCFTAAPLVHNDVEGGLGYVGYLTAVYDFRNQVLVGTHPISFASFWGSLNGTGGETRSPPEKCARHSIAWEMPRIQLTDHGFCCRCCICCIIIICGSNLVTGPVIRSGTAVSSLVRVMV